jgi:hypothetical protein
VGWLPTYYYAIGAPEIPLDIDWVYSFDIWLSYHRDLGSAPRVRRMIDWAIEQFNPQKCPWFRDEFIHRTTFEKHFRSGAPGEIDAAFGRPKNDAP